MNEEKINELIAQAKQGDQEACYQIWEGLAALRSNWMRQTYLEFWNKEDLEQQSYVVLLEAIQEFDESLGMGFAGYYKTMLRVWSSKKRRRKTCESSNVESVEREMMNHTTGSMVEFHVVEDQSVLHQVVELINSLDEEERMLLIDSVFKSLSSQELVRKYGISQGNIRIRRKRIRDKIRKELEKN